MASITGTANSETLTGTSAADVIKGLAGNDTIIGNGGSDNMDGGDGDDSITGSLNADFIHGGNGADVIDGKGFSGAGGPDYLYGDAGNDTITGGVGTEWIYGGTENDSITSGSGTGYLYGEAGDDVFYITTGTNTSGFDQFDGGTGLGTIRATTSSSNIGIDKCVDVETISTSGNTNVKILLDPTGAAFYGENTNIDVSILGIYGQGGSDTIRLAGSFGTTTALTRNDLVFAGGGDDLVLGGLGSDTLQGDAGNDTLSGGEGADNLTGGANADRFQFSSQTDSFASKVDTVKDFSQTDLDKIDISGIDANLSVAGNQTFVFIGNAAFSSGTPGQLRTANLSDGVHIYGDNNGDALADFEIIASGSVAFSSNDFVL